MGGENGGFARADQRISGSLRLPVRGKRDQPERGAEAAGGDCPGDFAPAGYPDSRRRLFRIGHPDRGPHPEKLAGILPRAHRHIGIPPGFHAAEFRFHRGIGAGEDQRAGRPRGVDRPARVVRLDSREAIVRRGVGEGGVNSYREGRVVCGRCLKTQET